MIRPTYHDPRPTSHEQRTTIHEPRTTTGDIAKCYADPGFAREALGWRAELRIEDICRDAWRWQQWQTEHAAEL